MRWRARVVIGAVGLLLSAPLFAAQASGDYLRALDLYRRGEFDAAVTALLALPADRAVDGADSFGRGRLAREPEAVVAPARAALLLHTEAWIERTTGQPFRLAEDEDVYLTSARSLAARLARHTPDFIRDWYLLVAAYLHGRLDLARSRVHLAEARKRFPGDAQILLATASDHEMLSHLATGSLQYFEAAGNQTSRERIDPDREMRTAIAFFRRALDAAPDLFEARLRLGRLLYRQGDLDGATRELDAAIAASPPPPVKYLAAVFRGLVAAARADFARARAHYDDAAKIHPRGQAVAVARSELAYLEGRPADAARLMTALLGAPPDEDPWWSYLTGEGWHFRARRNELRVEVTR
jgi:tetratricopeptide (TPR) repeat protein